MTTYVLSAVQVVLDEIGSHTVTVAAVMEGLPAGASPVIALLPAPSATSGPKGDPRSPRVSFGAVLACARGTSLATMPIRAAQTRRKMRGVRRRRWAAIIEKHQFIVNSTSLMKIDPWC